MDRMDMPMLKAKVLAKEFKRKAVTRKGKKKSMLDQEMFRGK